MQLLTFLKEAADSLDSLVKFTSLYDISHAEDPFLEILEVVDVPSK